MIFLRIAWTSQMIFEFTQNATPNIQVGRVGVLIFCYFVQEPLLISHLTSHLSSHKTKNITNIHLKNPSRMATSEFESFLPPRERLVSWLARLYRHRLTTTTGGNLSMMDDDGILYITPSGGDKALVPPSNVAILQPGFSAFEGSMAPSMEWRLHLYAYQARQDCRAVLHAHSMALIAFSLALDNGSISSRGFRSSSDSVVNHSGVPGMRYKSSIIIINNGGLFQEI